MVVCSVVDPVRGHAVARTVAAGPQVRPGRSAARRVSPAGGSHPIPAALKLQQLAGNRAVASLLTSTHVQRDEAGQRPLSRGEVDLTFPNGKRERRRVVRICNDGVLHFDPPGRAHMSKFRSIDFGDGRLAPGGTTAEDLKRFFAAVGMSSEPCGKGKGRATGAAGGGSPATGSKRGELVKIGPNGPWVRRGPGQVRTGGGATTRVPDVEAWYRSRRRQSGFKPGEAMAGLLKHVVVGGVEYIVDLGRGALHVGRYAKATVIAIWDPSELKQLARDDVAFIAMVYRLLRHPRESVERIALGYAAVLAVKNKLSPREQEQVRASVAARLPETVQKLLGKMIAKKIVITALVQPLLAKISARLQSSLAKKFVSKLKGAPLLALSVLGIMDKAHTARGRLEADNPLLYAYLEAHDLEMAWFLVEPHLAEIKPQIEAKLR